MQRDRRIGVVLVAWLAVAGPARAQQAAPAEGTGALEEVVVTARKRTESLQDTPLSVAAFSAADVVARSAVSLADIGSVTPNVSFNAASEPGGGSSAQVFVRGVGQQDYLITSDPGVGVYLDGVYLGRTTAGVLSLNDIERVEVLRGPQGDLFGRNTIGGAISVVSKRPNVTDREGFVQAGFGSGRRIEYSGAFNQPAGDKAAFRLAARGIVRDGFGRSTRTDIDYGNEDNHALRAQFLVGVTDTLQLLVAADYYDQNQNGAPAAWSGARPGFDANQALYNVVVRPFQNPGYPLLNTAQITGDLYTSSVSGPSVNDSTVRGASITLDYTAWDFADLHSITAYRDLDYRIVNDNDGIANEVSFLDDSTEQWQISQELQFIGKGDTTEWVAGLFYFHEEAEADTFNIVFRDRFAALEAFPGMLGPFGGRGNPANINVDTNFFTFQDINTSNYGAYGQVNFRVGERARITLGARYSDEEKKYFTFTNRLGSGRASIVPTTLQDSWGSFTPRVSFDFKLTPSLLLYASGTRGFKSGTFNGRASGQATVNTLDPEELITYELGAKTDWLDRRLRVNAALFYSDYEDIQLLFVNSANQQEAVNAGTAEIYGLELEVAGKPTDTFTVGLSAGYTHGELSDVPAAILARPDSFRDGMWLAKTPRWTGAVYSQYEWSLGESQLRVRGDYSYRSKFYQRPINEPIALQDAYGLLDARATWLTREGALEFAVFGTNLTDEEYTQAIIVGGTGAATSYPARGREWGASIRYEF
jgi:iron complex outermembrane receptor protein